jgi:peptidoglycan/xylan/chitin deacetylase (PgdA/CDA1 family)
VLSQNGVQAWFFMIGQRAVQYPDVVRRIVAEGHLVGNHSWSHPAPRTLSAAAYVDDVGRSRDALEQLLGRSVPDFRPPHGFLTARVAMMLWRRGHRIVLWNVDPKDYATADSNYLVGCLERLAIHNGDLVLLHDTHPQTITALEGGAMRVFARREAA